VISRLNVVRLSSFGGLIAAAGRRGLSRPPSSPPGTSPLNQGQLGGRARSKSSRVPPNLFPEVSR